MACNFIRLALGYSHLRNLRRVSEDPPATAKTLDSALALWQERGSNFDSVKKGPPMRILAKTTTYGIMHMAVAFIAALIVTGEAHIALGISLLEPVLQITAFWVHENIWEKYRPGSTDTHHHHLCCAESDLLDRVKAFFKK